MRITKHFWISAAALALFLSAPALSSSVNCIGGGDGGPGPMFEDISAKLVAGVHNVPTAGQAEDFVYQEKRNALVYRNTAGELWATPLESEHPEFLSKMEMPMSRLEEPTENYVVSDGQTWLYDIAQSGWTHFTGPTGPVQHLFWSIPDKLLPASRLFSLGAQVHAQKDRVGYRLYSYLPGQAGANACDFTAPTAYRLVKGHTQPYVVLFKEEPLRGGGRKVTFRRYTTSCEQWGDEQVVRLPKMPNGIDLEEAYFFSGMQAVALKFNHPRKNLAWVRWNLDGREVCQVYSIHNTRPVFLNDAEPVLATWSARGGINLYYLEKEKRASVLPELPLAGLDPRTLWLTRDGKKLFISPGERGEILSVDLRHP
jgi:hypothetical protein